MPRYKPLLTRFGAAVLAAFTLAAVGAAPLQAQTGNEWDVSGIDKSGVDKAVDESGLDKSLDETDVDRELDHTDIDKSGIDAPENLDPPSPENWSQFGRAKLQLFVFLDRVSLGAI